MTIPDPRFAPRRTDLPFLRRRPRPRIANQATPPPPPTAPRIKRAPSTPLRSDPTVGAEAFPPASAHPPSSPVAAPAHDTSLDLGSSTSTVLPPSSDGPRRRTPPPVRRGRRRRPGLATRLEVTTPSLTLTRVESGIGSLRFALAGPGADLLRLGCMYELRTAAGTHTEHLSPSAEPSARRDVVAVRKGEKPGSSVISVDLREVTTLRRLLLYAAPRTVSASMTVGTAVLVSSSIGGTLVEVPLTLGELDGTPLALASVFNVDGELVVRREVAMSDTEVRSLAERHGFVLPY